MLAEFLLLKNIKFHYLHYMDNVFVCMYEVQVPASDFV